MRTHRLLQALSIGVSLTVGACTDLKAVRDFAALSADTADYHKIIVNYAEYPKRYARYGTPSDPLTVRERPGQTEGLLAMQKVVTDYMTVLAKLAAEDATTFDTGPMMQAAQKVGLLDAAGATAATSIVNVVLKLATGAIRQERVKQTIEGANDSLQDLLGRLQAVVVRVRGEDTQELSRIDAYYFKLDADSRDPAGRSAAKDWREVRETEVRSRSAGEDAYLKAINRIKQGHQLLFDRRNDLSREETIKEIRSIEADLREIAKFLQP